jgi:hypothetical protein
VASGTYTLKAEATVVPGETSIADNILVDGTVRIGPAALMKVEPPIVQTQLLNKTFAVNITINNLWKEWRVIAVQFRLCYNSSLVQFLNVTEGDFLKYYASQQPGSYGTLFVYLHDENHPLYGPSVIVGVMILPDGTGHWHPPFPEGNGTIATVFFKTIYQERGLENPPLTFNFELVETDVFDDEGVTIPYNVQHGVFNMWPTHIADTNYDGKVDLKDYFRIVNAFGETPGRPRWDPKADINGDGKVDLKDVYTCATGFGWTAKYDP